MAEGNNTQGARVSFRSTAANIAKLKTIAEANGWVNQKGQPNLSQVLNFLIDTFDVSKVRKSKKKKTEASRGKRKR